MDLSEPGMAGKERDARFVARVFTPAERTRILADHRPSVALWKTWAAKETAFKVARKLRDGLVFAHRAFEVTMDGAHEGVVRFEDLVVRVRWEVDPDYVHCIGVTGADWRSGFSRVEARIAKCRELAAGRLSAAECASVYSAASERVRLLARTILERWNLSEAEVVRRWRASGWSAPLVAQRGRLLEGFDVSLSHDGRFVAAAVLRPPM